MNLSYLSLSLLKDHHIASFNFQSRPPEDTTVSDIAIDGLSLEDDARSVGLNNDVLCHIFTYLSVKDRVRVERVCKQWQAAARLSWSLLPTLHFRGVFKRFEGGFLHVYSYIEN